MEIGELYDRAKAIWGRERQTMKAVEELSELIEALSRLMQFYNAPILSDVAEEIADVRIMLEQVERFYGLESHVEDWRDYKLERLAGRVGFAEEEKVE